MPGLAVRVCPACARPLMLGRPVFTGCCQLTAGVLLLAAGAEGPAAFDATTATRSVVPASASPSV